MLRRLAISLSILAAGMLLATSHASAAGPKQMTPEKGTVYAELYNGLKAVADGKFDKWISKYCSKEKYCITSNAIKSIKHYNLPAAKRQAPFCLKGDKLEVTRTDGDPKKDDSVKIFIQCNPKGMPRPYQMVKEGGTWKFAMIY